MKPISEQTFNKHKVTAAKYISEKWLTKWGHSRGTHVLCAFVEVVKAKSFAEVGSQTALQSYVLSKEFPKLDVFAIDINPINLNNLPEAPRFVEMVCDSVIASSKFEDYSIDVVYIDADHTYESVKKDLVSWYPKVRMGGIFSGHDYNHPQHPGVKAAVDEFINENNLTLNLADYYNWYVFK